MDSFIEYMWYLLTSPLKKVKKSINHWYTLCKVFGSRFDEAKECILLARDEGMIATCRDDMLRIHAVERGLSRYTGESLENFRSRIAMYTDICYLGGLNDGIILAVKSLGYKNFKIISAKELKGDIERWAEFYVVIEMDVMEEHPIGITILRKTVRQWKEVSSKDNYLMSYHKKVNQKFIPKISKIKYTRKNYFYVYAKLDGSWNLDGKETLNVSKKHPTRNTYKNKVVMHHEQNHKVTLRGQKNLYYFDGSWKLDGIKKLDAYYKMEVI